MQNKDNIFWEHYCDKQNDVVGFPKGTECDWCGTTEEDIMSNTISIDSFNNKGQKGDDDFETWLANEAPFVDDATTGTLAEGSSSYTITNSSIASMGSYCPTPTTTFTIKDSPHFATTKQKKLPIDILHKWYPEEMKETND